MSNVEARNNAPQYLKDAMRADLLVGLPGDNLQLADATINSFLSARNVSISWIASASMPALSGAISDGFSTTVQPAAIAGAILHTTWCSG